ncbi:uncharacterized protein LOC135121569 isoform X2 [Zophobas morio]|uniref:uncharacterized protein LOC135121569 isoform X2 n=1 Tax=Zophobas morio TaxID=2755281 RepID=UPI003082BDB6
MTCCNSYSLSCHIQHYGWGKKGKESKVAKLMGTKADPNKPYAELWVGTHKKGPSFLRETNILLSEYIDKEKEAAVGRHCYARFASELPFLFKVLSIRKTLSIQAHPDKLLARALHQKDPANYPDKNHKPELAIALEDFEALCGFRKVDAILHFFSQYKEFARVVGESFVESLIRSYEKSDKDLQRKCLKECFTQLMNADEVVIKQSLAELVSALRAKGLRNSLEDLIIRIYKDFSSDPGVFCILFMNYIKLKPGDALFVRPNTPHAYLSGDCVEAMACSDNVVRAGLTGKFKDVSTLCDMLDYSSEGVDEFVVSGRSHTANIIKYAPPVEEFAVDRIQFVDPPQAFQLEPYAGPSILLCIEGCALTNLEPGGFVVKRGTILFIPYNATFTLAPSAPDFVAFRVYCVLGSGEEQANESNGKQQM